MTTELNRIIPGELLIDGMHLVNYRGERIDIRYMVNELNLYQEIGAPFVTGKALVVDSISMISQMELVGEEMIELTLVSPITRKVYTRLFHVYKIANRQMMAIKSTMYEVYFASIEAYVDMNMRLVSRYTGRISDLVEKIATKSPGLKTTKPMFIEQTGNSISFIGNHWSPTQGIYYLASKAISSFDTEDFVFFENNEGFVFASLTKLYTLPKVATFVKSQYMRDVNSGEDLSKEYSKILDMQVATHFDYIDRHRMGYYGASTYQYNLVNKRLNYRVLVPKDELKTKIMNDDLFESDAIVANPEAMILNKTVHPYLYDDRLNLVPVTHEARRNALLRRSQSLVLNIEVFGNIDYGVGRMYEVIVFEDKPEYKDTPDSEMIDNYLSGNYIATRVHHRLTKEGMRTRLELSKDSRIELNTSRDKKQ